ncbi:MAG TPA: TIGR02679 domain-containing protein [Micromonosporaceae bacterium]|nr:TIGR02679 domain-containing protein [Micromonosporaceae bacterium]
MADLVTDPGWRRLLAAARRSLQRTGGDLAGTVSLTAPSESERLVVIGITGVHRPAGIGRLAVRLSELDEYLRAAHGAGLAATLGPLRDRPGERTREALRRDAVTSLAAVSRHAGQAWYSEWLDGLRRDGTLTRIVRNDLPYPDVIAVLNELPAPDEPMAAFAERVLGDTKALTEGFVPGLVLRALSLWHATGPPNGAEQERRLWELAGLVPDDLASQVLVLAVPATGGVLGDWLTSAASAGVPFRVTLHQLRLTPLVLDCDEIFVCENPAVLRAAASRPSRPSRPLVCTEGVPSVAVHALLRAARPRTRIRWRNDFDWTGVRLTGAALARYPDATPWRMAATDYGAEAPRGIPLVGSPATTPWDPELAAAMRQTGRAVMEERLLEDLLDDLHRPTSM